MFFDAGWVDFSEYKIVHKSLFVWRISLENVNVFVIDSAVPLMDLAYRRCPGLWSSVVMVSRGSPNAPLDGWPGDAVVQELRRSSSQGIALAH